MSRDSIRARVAAATEGTWSVSVWEDGYLTVDFDTEDGISVIPMDEANTAFIAHARQDVPALLAVADAAADDITGCDLCGEVYTCSAHKDTREALAALEALP